MTGYSDEQIELMVARLGTDEYNQGVPRCAPWRTSLSCSGPDRWIVYQPTGSDQSRIITEGARQPFADFIVAARELVPSLLARAQQAEAAVAERLRQFNAAKDQRDAALAEADRLRAELAEAKAENEALRQVAQSDRETAKDYADEIAAAHAERDRLAAQVAAVRAAAEKAAKALQWLPSQYTVAEENSLRVVSLLYEDVYRIGAELRAALDGAGQDEAGEA